MDKRCIVRTATEEQPGERQTEIVERKGLGHPDTICDNTAEQVSVDLCRFYIEEFGAIMHHNIDKALLVGGTTNPKFGGGDVMEPIQLILAGRAIKEIDEKHYNIDTIAEKAIRRYFSEKFRFIDDERHIDISIKIRQGSRDLVELFNRFSEGEIPLANDTSYGVGFYPLDELEETVYKTEKFLNDPATKESYPFIGEDIKIMGVRQFDESRITLAMAMVDKYISSKDDYFEKKEAVKDLIKEQPWFKENFMIDINTADSYIDDNIYLTVTGTSAEQGDDGQVGRGNRANGLITPSRPMTIEAVAGKNPVSHVGKIYNLFALDLSREIVNRNYAGGACVHVVSQIGKPINDPQIMDIELRDRNVKDAVITELAQHMLNELPQIWKRVMKGEYEVA